MIIDTHSHLNFKAYDADRDEVLKRTKEAGIMCINVGTKFETSKKAVEMAEQSDFLFAAIGMHPIHIKNDFMKLRMDDDEGGFVPSGEEFSEEKYLALAESKKVVAVGEIGLDYYYKPKTTARLAAFKALQKEVLEKQIDFARKIQKPLIIHCRMAHKDMAEILRQKDVHHGVIHCFTGTVEEMKKYLDLGFHIGINGIIFKLNLDEVIKECPIEKMVAETDCPYLTPTAENGKRNEPIFIKHTIQKIADLKGMSFEEICQKTTQNAKKLFAI